MMDRIVERFRLRPIPPSEYERLRHHGAREVIKTFGLPWWKVPSLARYVRTAMAADRDSFALFPGTPEMLAELGGGGVKLAIVSSNSEENIRAVLGPENAARIGWYECGSSLFGKARKFRRVLRRTGTAPAQALCIGDEIRDHEAAQQAGIAFGAVAWGYTAAAALGKRGPAFLFRSVQEITEMMKGEAAA